MILKTLLFLLILIIFIILTGYLNILKNYKKTKQDIYKIYLAIKRMRYGNVHIRVENLYDKELENAVNRLFETILDREMMIKEYQNTLAKKNLSLEEIIKQEKEMRQVKEDFTATLTHDMKVPVIAELNSLDFLLDGRFGELNDKQIEVLKLIKSSNKELKELIENLLEVYKLEQKEIKLKLKQACINDFLYSVINDMSSIFIENNIEIKLNNEETQNIYLLFDIFQLKRVVKNLLQNAVSFNGKGNEILINTHCSNTDIKIEITNKGSGISKEDLDFIFNKYYSGHSKFGKAGTGLGLYISRQIMLAHNGNIELDVSKKGFTTFILTLPK